MYYYGNTGYYGGACGAGYGAVAPYGAGAVGYANGYGGGYGAAIWIVLFILLVIIIGAGWFGGNNDCGARHQNCGCER